MSENSNQPSPGSEPEEPLFAPLLRVKGVLIASIVLVVCIMVLELPLWFRIALMVLIIIGAIWVASATREDAIEDKPQGVHSTNEMADVSGERLAELLTDPMIVFDQRGTVLFTNAAALDAFQSLEKDTGLYLRFRAPEMHALIQGVIADGRPRSIDYFERVPIDRWYKAMVKALRDVTASQSCLFFFSAIRAKHGALTVCVRTSLPMPVTNCAPRLPHCWALSKRCRDLRATMQQRVTGFSSSCRNRLSACRA